MDDNRHKEEICCRSAEDRGFGDEPSRTEELFGHYQRLAQPSYRGIDMFRSDLENLNLDIFIDLVEILRNDHVDHILTWQLMKFRILNSFC